MVFVWKQPDLYFCLRKLKVTATAANGLVRTVENTAELQFRVSLSWPNSNSTYTNYWMYRFLSDI